MNTMSDSEARAAADRIVARLGEYLTPAEAMIWLSRPHAQLEGEKPIDVLEAGQFERVQAILDRLDAGAYL